jgi:hypothetical protein
MNQIAFLTPEQESLIPQYQEKWNAIALSTKRIDRQKAEAAVKEAYALTNKKAPKIMFCQSPYEALLLKVNCSDRKSQSESIATQLSLLNILGFFFGFSIMILVVYWLNLSINNFLIKIAVQSLIVHILMLFWRLSKKVRKLNRQKNPILKLQLQLTKTASKFLTQKLEELLPQRLNRQEMENWDFPDTKKFTRFWLKQSYQSALLTKIQGIDRLTVGQEIQDRLSDELQLQFFTQLQNHLPGCVFEPYSGAISSIWLDFVFSVLNFSIDAKKWQALQQITRECGWIFVFDNTCVICDRPTKLSVDERNRLHAEGEPAIKFADGFTIYAYHGLNLPIKYGATHRDRWQASWLLKETNAELRRALIQKIGYERICQELNAIELDSWREYTLLIINNRVNIEPIYLLKMTCPSTGYVRMLRVPPNIQSAREAIRWANWDIDPEEFAVET